ncbi:MAG TPA: AI-2E family transporter [Gemmatimonadaceae bacterium]|nr:AI-2E family transporter [Gemmatimonadaceae bacterium]
MSALSTGRFRFGSALAATVLTVLLLLLLGRTAELFLLLFIAVLFSLYLGAVADAIQRRVTVPRRSGVLLAVLLTLVIIAGFIWIIVPPVVSQTQALLKVLPQYIINTESAIDQMIARNPALRSVWHPGEHRVILAIYDQVSGYFADVVPKLFGALGFTIEIVSVAIMGIYLAVSPGVYREYLIALFPPVHRDLVRNVLGDLSRTLRAWIVGQLASMSLLGALTAVGLAVLGVPYWLTFGIFTGIVAIVPFFGSLVSTLLPAAFVLGAGSPGRALGVVLLGVIVHLIEGNLVAPKIMQRQLALPPVMTIMSVLIMGKLLGPIGLLVAVPVIAVLDVVTRRLLIDRLYEGQGFRRLVRDRAFVVRAPAPEADVIVPDPPPDVLAGAEEAQRRHVA